jgi:hypothetical protein
MNTTTFEPSHELDPFAEPRDHANAWDMAALPHADNVTKPGSGKFDSFIEPRDHANAWDMTTLWSA